ncbi:Gfo/Idh/MocA family protein [Cohnella cellulosilytica]|uniref:Gfo/Idh/MocA family protein n=1 Tax=Cohnella cellulosilytica TaxID=986710 RepID=A0ABW2F5J7_9BACL
MKKWNFGMIGCGGIARFHAAALQEMDNARLVCAASRTAEKAAAMASEFGCEWTRDYRALLERTDIDIVNVTTSSGSHAFIGREVLEAGKHLVMEKPITMTEGEAQQLIDLARSRGLVVSVISQMRFEPYFQSVKRLLDEGKLGRLLLIEAGTPYSRSQEYYDSADWRGTIAEDGGALMNQGIHQIDLLLWLGGPAKSVFGKIATMTHRMEAEDMGVAVVEFINGAIGTILSTTSVKPGFPPYIHLYTDKGTVKLVGQSAEYWSVEGVEEPTSPNAQHSDGSSDPLAISHIYHRKQLEQLLQSMDNGLAPLVGGADGKRAVELIRAIYASSESGSKVCLL